MFTVLSWLSKERWLSNLQGNILVTSAKGQWITVQKNNKTNQKAWEERLRNEMLWGIGVFKRSKILLVIQEAMFIPRLCTYSVKTWEGPICWALAFFRFVQSRSKGFSRVVKCLAESQRYAPTSLIEPI